MKMEEAERMYAQNDDFRQYVDRFCANNPEYSHTEALKHRIIQNVAEFYMKNQEERK